MAKKQKITGSGPAIQNDGSTKSHQATTLPVDNNGQSFLSFNVQAIILAILGLVFYANSFVNEFALDDRPIIVENEYVRQGLAGIPKILTSDAFDSYFRQQNAGNSLTGGRYRPLSIVTFAIEQQFLGLPEEKVKTDSKEPAPDVLSDEAKAKIVSDMHVRHVVNVLLYILSVIVFLSFLRKIVFPGNVVIPFVAAVLFIIHPLHTEVVSNVKSRDEILSLMFICLTLMYAIRYRDEAKRPLLIKSLLFFFLTLLSKEYGVTLLLLIPASLYLFRKDTINKSIAFTLPFLAPFALYFLMRIAAESHSDGVVPADVMNLPYLYATATQRFASIISILLKYFELMVFPHPLVSDYSYKQIPYRDLSDPIFWLSAVFYSGLVTAMVRLFKKRHLLAFAIAFYLLHMFLISNILVNIGAPMGERLVYHSSAGFVIAVAYGLYLLFNKIKPERSAQLSLGALLLVLIVFSAFKTIDRNKAWKNDRILYLIDVKTSPNSVLELSNAGSACVDYGDDAKDSVQKKIWYNRGIEYFNKTLAIDPKFANAYKNRGVCYYQTGFPDRAMADWDTLRAIYPTYPSLPYMLSIIGNYYYKEGITNGKAGNHEAAIVSFAKAAHARTTDPDVWYNLGYANYSAGHYQEAMHAFENAMKLHATNTNVSRYYEECKLKVGSPGAQSNTNKK